MQSRRVMSCALALILIFCTSICLAKTQKEEESLGRKYAAQYEESCILITDSAQNDRVNAIGSDIVAIANSIEVPASYGSSEIYHFNYKFKVIEDPDVNAVSFPGGIIYVNTGLLDLIETDDELAGVLAHEVAHAAHHHHINISHKQGKVDRIVSLLTVAAVLAGPEQKDLKNIVLGSQLLRTGKLSGYTMEAERDADRTAVAYLVKTKYSPTGLVKLMAKLDKERDENPTLPLGLYQTHPAPFRRIIAINDEMQKQGIEINNRETPGAVCAKSVASADGSGCEVVVCDKIVCKLANLPGRAASKRGEEIAKRINEILDTKPNARDLNIDINARRIAIGDSEVFTITSEDELISGDTTQALLDRARSVLSYAIWADWLVKRSQQTQTADDLSSN